MSDELRFEWDERKNQGNFAKHKIRFQEAELIWNGLTYTEVDEREYNEERFITYGFLGRAILAVIHTERDDVIRIISARTATPRERKKFYEKIYRA